MSVARRGYLLCPALVTGASVLPGAAAAHNPLPGLDGFYAGLWHPLSTPDQALVLVALALLLGSFALARLMPAFLGLAFGLLIGMSLGPVAVDVPLWLLALACGAASWAALLPGRGRGLAAGFAALAGIGLGLASVPEAGPSTDRMITMAGSFAGVMLATFYLSGGIDLLRDRVRLAWLPIALRVVAAWVAALSVLMLAFALSGTAA